MSRAVSGWAMHMPGVALLAARLYVGYWLLVTGIAKLQRGFLFGGALLPQVQRFVDGTPHAWYKAWLTTVVIPHERVFAILTSTGETLAGVALILGAMTRFSAGVGIFMVANYLFAKGWSNPTTAHDKDFVLLLLVVLIGAAGDYWGVDGWRGRRG